MNCSFHTGSYVLLLAQLALLKINDAISMLQIATPSAFLVGYLTDWDQYIRLS